MTEIIRKTLYNWTETIDFYPNSHQYKRVTIEDWKEKKENLISVTAITWVVDKSWPLMFRATNLARDYLLQLPKEEITPEEIIKACMQHKTFKEQAASIWKQAHERAEMYIKAESLSLPEDPKVASAVWAFLDRVEHSGIKFIESEFFVYSKLHWYIWTGDATGTIWDKKYLIDFKTSNAIRTLEYWMQTAWYLRAKEEETGEKYDWIIIVRFSKDEDWFETKFIEDQEEIDYLYEAFLAAKKLKIAVKRYDTWGKTE